MKDIPKCKNSKSENCKSEHLKPNIVFYGEKLPGDNLKQFDKEFFKDTDLLLIMGTSLKVQPFCDLVEMVPPGIPRILINDDNVGYYDKCTRDYFLKGNCDKTIHEICENLGWKQKFQSHKEKVHKEKEKSYQEDSFSATNILESPFFKQTMKKLGGVNTLKCQHLVTFQEIVDTQGEFETMTDGLGGIKN